MDNNCCKRAREIPPSLWIALVGLGLVFLNVAYRYVADGLFRYFVSSLFVTILLGGLFLRQSWAFFMAIAFFILWFLVGFQAWDYDRLLWLKNLIAGAFILVPVIMNKDWLMPADQSAEWPEE